MAEQVDDNREHADGKAVVVAGHSVPGDIRERPMFALLIEALGLKGCVRIEQWVWFVFGGSIIHPAERIDPPSVHGGDEPFEFVLLRIVGGVSGMNHEVDRTQRYVHLIDRSYHAVEQMDRVSLLGTPG